MSKYIIGRQSQNRMKMIRYCVAIGLYLFFAVILQTSVLSRLKPFGGVPDIILPTVICIAIYCGSYAGAVTGICAGFLSDALGSVGISLLPLVYFLVGYLIGYYARVLNVKGFLAYLIGVGISLVARFAATLALTLLSAEHFQLSAFLLQTALPELAGTVLLSIPFYFPVMGVCKWLRARE